MDDPRYQAILKWSLAQQGSDPAPAEGVKPMTEEDRKFLEAAIASITVDEVEIMKACARILATPLHEAEEADTKADSKEETADAGTAPRGKGRDKYGVALITEGAEDRIPAELRTVKNGEALIEQKAAALDELMDRVLTIDNARDLHLIGGLVPLIKTLDEQYPSLQWRAAEVLATVVQNNPQSQAWALELGSLPRLLRLIQTPVEAGNEKVPVKALYALSGLVMQFEAGQAAFTQAGGWQVLAAAAKSDTPKLAGKAALMIVHLTDNSTSRMEANRAAAFEAGLLPVLVDLMGSEDVTARDFSVQGIIHLIEGSEVRLAYALSPDVNLLVRARERVAHLQTLPREDNAHDLEQVLSLVGTIARERAKYRL